MSNTANYNWNIPDNTDLVKDGALAIRTLGNAIDTSMNTALGTKKAGMVLLNTTSFSGVATQAVSSIFSSTYDNYRVIINNTSFTSDGYRFLRLRSGSTDLTTGTYGYALAGVNTSGTNYPLNSGATTFWNIGDMDSATDGTYSVSFDIHNPFLALKTNATYISVSSTGAGLFFTNAGGANNTNATSYDGFSISTSAGNMSGTIWTYGYNK